MKAKTKRIIKTHVAAYLMIAYAIVFAVIVLYPYKAHARGMSSGGRARIAHAVKANRGALKGHNGSAKQHAGFTAK